MTENNLEQAMLIAWRHGRDDARAGKQRKSDAVLAVLPTQDERDCYRAGYERETMRLASGLLDKLFVK